MRPMMLALLVGATMLAVPNAAATHACDDPGTVAEVCTDTGSESGEVHSKEVSLAGCIVSVNGQCIPHPLATGVDNGPGIAAYNLPTVYVGVDVNVCPPLPPILAVHCSVVVDTGPTTAKVASLT